jgi:hypothetical protein
MGGFLVLVNDQQIIEWEVGFFNISGYAMFYGVKRSKMREGEE